MGLKSRRMLMMARHNLKTGKAAHGEIGKEGIQSGRKGEISISMLIWIALGLIVLIIFIAILTGKVNFFNRNSPDTCMPVGHCYNPSDSCNGISIKTNDCPVTKDSKDTMCCRPFN